MLQVCLNGARSPREHFQLPVRPEELAKAAAGSVAAGATEIHLHPKAHDGTDSIDAHLLASALRAVRAAAAGIPVGVTTSVWSMPEITARVRAIAAWTVLPDYASVSWHEPGAADIAAALAARGVGVEAVITSGTDADERFRASAWPGKVRRVTAAVGDRTARGAAGTAEALLARLHPVTARLLLHGSAAGAWPVLSIAAAHGVAARIGLEDTLLLPDGSVAAGNAELVTAARHILSSGPRPQRR